MPTDSRTRAEFVMLLAGTDPSLPHKEAVKLPSPPERFVEKGYTTPVLYAAMKEMEYDGIRGLHTALILHDEFEPADLLVMLQSIHDTICGAIEEAKAMLDVPDNARAH